MGLLRFTLRFFPLLILFLGGAICVVLSSLIPGEHPVHGSWAMRVYRGWSRVFLALLGVRVSKHGHAVEPGTFLVANHVSWLDILLTAAVFPVRFVSKAEVAKWPVVGFVAKRLGTVFHDRGSNGAAANTSDKMVAVLQSGKSILVFPEGTTTSGVEVRTFHARLYQAAIAADKSAQAVTINYKSECGNPCAVIPYVNGATLIWNLFRIMSLHSAEAEIVVCERVHDVKMPRKALAKITHEHVCHALTELRSPRDPSLPLE